MNQRLLLHCVAILCLWGFSARALVLQTTPKRQQRQRRNLAIPKQFAIAALVVCTGAAPAFAGDIAQGQTLFNDNCASCHMGGANFVKPERTLQKAALEKYGIGVDQPSILSFVTNSQKHKNLVFFRAEGGKLKPQQWEDVTTFISDQAKGEKW